MKRTSQVRHFVGLSASYDFCYICTWILRRSRGGDIYEYEQPEENIEGRQTINSRFTTE